MLLLSAIFNKITLFQPWSNINTKRGIDKRFEDLSSVTCADNHLLLILDLKALNGF